MKVIFNYLKYISILFFVIGLNFFSLKAKFDLPKSLNFDTLRIFDYNNSKSNVYTQSKLIKLVSKGDTIIINKIYVQNSIEVNNSFMTIVKNFNVTNNIYSNLLKNDEYNLLFQIDFVFDSLTQNQYDLNRVLYLDYSIISNDIISNYKDSINCLFTLISNPSIHLTPQFRSAKNCEVVTDNSYIFGIRNTTNFNIKLDSIVYDKSAFELKEFKVYRDNVLLHDSISYIDSMSYAYLWLFPQTNSLSNSKYYFDFYVKVNGKDSLLKDSLVFFKVNEIETSIDFGVFNSEISTRYGTSFEKDIIYLLTCQDNITIDSISSVGPWKNELYFIPVAQNFPFYLNYNLTSKVNIKFTPFELGEKEGFLVCQFHDKQNNKFTRYQKFKTISITGMEVIESEFNGFFVKNINNEYLKIEFNENDLIDDYLQIFNLSGINISNKTFNSNFEINIQELPSGVYIGRFVKS
ncbi:MAG: T9SS type A sorting domain-containing protein, partial [Candidatus Kapabacteria bacterium]|nr:T9SS type A sorting domain-containing protein [Candidatus Kapabacteria bacterium]